MTHGASVNDSSDCLGLYIGVSVMAWDVSHLQVFFLPSYCIHCCTVIGSTVAIVIFALR